MRELIRSAGGWRVAYEVSLALVVTAAVTIPAAAAQVYPLAPWLAGLTTPVLLLLRLTNAPVAYLGAAVAGMCTGGENSLLLAVLSASFAYRTAHWRHLGAGLAAAWICFVGAEWWWGERPDLETVVLLSAFFALIAVLPAGVARLVRRQRTLFAAMHRRNELLHSEQTAIARKAQARERTRIARDLHDSLGHKLTLISLYAGMAKAPGESGRDAAELLGETSSAAMTELRQILGILQQDDQQPAVGSLDGLDDLARTARASGAQVRFVREGEPRPLPALTGHAAYRVIQEGVTNALRHAHGGEITMSLRYEPDALVAAVTNTAGRGVSGTTSGQGLLGLAERVRVANGVLHHGRTPDGGFRLAAQLPYPAPEDAAEPAGSGPMPPPAAETDFAHLVQRDRRRSRLVLVATTLAIGGLLTLCGAGVWLVTTFVTVDRETYDAVRVGQPEAEVRALLPDQDAGTVGGAADATCVDYQASLLDQLRTETDLDLVYRFCYRDGRLVDKQAVDSRNGVP